MVQVPTFKAGAANLGAVRGPNLRQVQQPDIGAAISDVGTAVAGVSAGLAKEEREVGLAFKKAEAARALNNETANASRNLSIFSKGLESEPDDYQNWQKRHDEFTSSVIEDARKRLDPDVFDAFKADYTRSATKSFIGTINGARKVAVDKGKADLGTNLSIYSDLYATAADPEDRKTVLGQAMLSISDAQNTGIINEQTANDQRDSFLQSVEETRLENDLNSDPTLTQVNFESGEYEISEESKPAFAKRIDTSVRAQESERIRVYEKNERDQEKALKLEQESLEIDFREKLLNNELSDAEIIDAGQSRKLSVTQVKSLLSDNNKTNKVQSDPEEYDKTLKLILDNQLSTDQILDNPDLSSKDKKTFTGMVTTFRNQENTAQAKQRNEDEKNISSSIRPFIITTGPLAQFVKSDEQILYQSAVEEMRERLDNGENPDKIKTDIISRYSRVPISTDQLPRLRYGSHSNIPDAKAQLVGKLNAGQISIAEAEDQAELIQRYEQAIKNQEELTRLNTSGRTK